MSEKVTKKKNVDRDKTKKKKIIKKDSQVKADKKKKNEGVAVSKRSLINKKNIMYLVIVIIDILLIIYSSRKNVVNYVDVYGKNIIVGGSQRLFFGKNYITIIVTLFFYGYICLVNRFMFKEKNSKRFLIGWLLFFILVNFLLFFLFTKRVY